MVVGASIPPNWGGFRGGRAVVCVVRGLHDHETFTTPGVIFHATKSIHRATKSRTAPSATTAPAPPRAGSFFPRAGIRARSFPLGSSNDLQMIFKSTTKRFPKLNPSPSNVFQMYHFPTSNPYQGYHFSLSPVLPPPIVY